MNKKLKGQVAAEFFAYSGIFILVVVLAISSVYYLQDSEFALYQNSYSLEVGHKFSSAFDLTVKAGFGFTYTIFYPEIILGNPYTIRFAFDEDSHSIVMTWNSDYGELVYPFVVSHVPIKFEGECFDQNSIGESIVSSDKGANTITFSNVDGTIVITHEGCP